MGSRGGKAANIDLRVCEKKSGTNHKPVLTQKGKA